MSEILTENELCTLLKVDRVFLWKCRKSGMPYFQLGSKIIRYSLEDVLNWFGIKVDSIVDKRV